MDQVLAELWIVDGRNVVQAHDLDTVQVCLHMEIGMFPHEDLS